MTAKTKDDPPDLRLIKALSHPLRHRILHALNLRVASPSELAEEFGEPLGNVAYHIKVLAEIGSVEEVRTEEARGALEHFYRATAHPWFDGEGWAELPVAARRAIFGRILADSWEDVAAAAEERKLQDPTTHISRTWLTLDQAAYEEIVEMLDSVVDRALEIQAEAAARLSGLPSPEREEHSTAMVLMHFHRASLE